MAVAICCYLLPTCLVAQTIETDRFETVYERLERLTATYASDRVLVVLDIDNTLLAMNQPLGSDQWFDWQQTLLETNPDSTRLVANDFAGLLRVQGVLFAIGRMHRPQDNQDQIVRTVQKLGCPTIVLTSRGDEYRSSAERELRRNGYDFSVVSLEITNTARGRFLPFDQETSSENDISSEIALQLGTPREVSYSNGIFMVAGQHKGYMLRSLLSRTEKTFDAICFVDDHQHHCDRIHDAFEGSGIDVITFRYSQEDENVASFDLEQKRIASQQWRRLERVLGELLDQTAIEE